jgi:DMSO/TMAO reductase YedYZ molybdopterin-dependent catalytic subunit
MSPLHPGPEITREELQLATRNHGMPLEALRHAVTPAGLHYLLIHYDIPQVDAGDWRLEIRGLVDRPRELTLTDLRHRPQVTAPVTFECAGNGRAALTPRPLSQPWLLEAVGTAEWTGTPLASLLAEVGLHAGAVDLVFTGIDTGVEGGAEQPYERSLSVAEAMASGAFLAHTMNGQPLPPQHGFPLRLVVPGWYGMANVKWLRSITAIAEPFAGYQQATAYRLRREESECGQPVARMAPRSLIVPPGIPDFFTRKRFTTRVPQRVEGRAWSGRAAIERVEFSADGGATWSPAVLEEPIGPWAWRGWSVRWEPGRAGLHVLCVRARDAAGNEQPLEPQWNLGGYAQNAVQRVEVEVRESGGDASRQADRVQGEDRRTGDATRPGKGR